jgi:hypothetical protein
MGQMQSVQPIALGFESNEALVVHLKTSLNYALAGSALSSIIRQKLDTI